MTILFKEQEIAFEGFDKARRSGRKKLRGHARDVAEGYAVREVLAEVVIERRGAIPAGP